MSYQWQSLTHRKAILNDADLNTMRLPEVTCCLSRSPAQQAWATACSDWSCSGWPWSAWTCLSHLVYLSNFYLWQSRTAISSRDDVSAAILGLWDTGLAIYCVHPNANSWQITMNSNPRQSVAGNGQNSHVNPAHCLGVSDQSWFWWTLCFVGSCDLCLLTDLNCGQCCLPDLI